MMRDLLYAGILARLWPSYVTQVNNPQFPMLLCVKSPSGPLTWRLTPDEAEFFDWIDLNEQLDTPARAADRTPTLHALAADGWKA